jgi:hypothetical protein
MKALPVLDSKAAATDVGSEKLHVSIAGDSPKVFGTFTSDLEALREWFKDRQVRTVGVEKGLKAYEAKVLATEPYLLRKSAKKQGFALIPATNN